MAIFILILNGFLIYFESTVIFSPDLSVAVKLISSKTFSIIV